MQEAQILSPGLWLPVESPLFKKSFMKSLSMQWPSLSFAFCSGSFPMCQTHSLNGRLRHSLFPETCIPELMTLLCDQPRMEVADVSLIGISPSIISAPLGTILHTSTPPIQTCLITLILMSFFVTCHYSPNVHFLGSILETSVYSLPLDMVMQKKKKH